MTHFLPRRLPRPRLHDRRAAGLSLLEMLLVIALIAAIGLITAAGLSRGFAGMQLRSAGRTSPTSCAWCAPRPSRAVNRSAS